MNGERIAMLMKKWDASNIPDDAELLELHNAISEMARFFTVLGDKTIAVGLYNTCSPMYGALVGRGIRPV
jgi:hypothetical protein